MDENLKIHNDLLSTQKVYEQCGLIIKNLAQEAESQDYGAYEFEMNALRIKFRVAKITPTKIGQFVTLWKRNEKGSPIMPFDVADPVDLFIISVRNRNNFGQFVFPKSVLAEKGFITQGGKGGKRALRIYPPWDKPESLGARKTQSWQLLYYYEIEPEFDRMKIQRLMKL